MRRQLETPRAATVVLLSGVFLVGACAELPPQAARQVEQARQALEARQHRKCERLLDPVIHSYAGHPGTALALYMRGQCRLLTEKRQEARGDFEEALRLARDRELRAWLEAQLGNMAFDDGYYGQACRYYAGALDLLSDGPAAERVLYQHALAQQRSRQFAEARRTFTEFCRKYPTSPFAPAARQKQLWEGDYFSVQCGAYNRIDLAHKAAASLRQGGVEALAFPEYRGGSKRYVVRVGRFQSYEQAAGKLAQVRRVQEDAFIVP